MKRILIVALLMLLSGAAGDLSGQSCCEPVQVMYENLYTDNSPMVGMGLDYDDLLLSVTGTIVNNSIWAAEFTPGGDYVWSASFGIGAGRSIKRTQDGGNIITGEFSGTPPDDMILIKTVNGGAVQWARTYGGVGTDYGRIGFEPSNSGVFAAGAGTPAGSANLDAMIVRTDAVGQILWGSYAGGPGDDIIHHAIELSGGQTYVLVGQSNSYGTSYPSVFVLWFDDAGNMINAAVYHTAYDAIAYGVAEGPGGSLVLVGASNTTSSSPRAFALMIDNGGTIIWQRNLGPGYVHAAAVKLTCDNTYIITGGYKNPISLSEHAFLVNLDQTSNTLWSNIYYQTAAAQSDGNDVVQLSDGGFVFTGQSLESPARLALASTDCYGATGCETGIATEWENPGFGVVSPFVNLETIPPPEAFPAAVVEMPIFKSELCPNDELNRAGAALPDSRPAATRPLYPNPVAQGAIVTIGLGDPADEVCDLSLIDLLGNRVHIRTTAAGPQNGELRFSTAGLAAGNYFVILSGNAGRSPLRLTVLP